MKLQDPNRIGEIVAPIGHPGYFEQIGKNSFAIPTQHSVINAVRSSIAPFFGINPEDPFFKDAFAQAVSGDGNEIQKIATLHSSSLLALLCFYHVSPANPLILEIKNVKHRFTEVFFEVKNKVSQKGHPSNMDITLWDPDTHTLLYLESKFVEPWRDHYKDGKPYYRRWLKMLGMEISPDCKMYTNPKFGEFTKNYYNGIKQMISHFIGILQGPANDASSDNTNRSNYEKCYSEAEKKGGFIFGTILFSGNNPFYDTVVDKEKIEALSNYAEMYEHFAQSLIDNCDKGLPLEADASDAEDVEPRLAPDRVMILTTPYSYQEMFGTLNPRFVLDEKVRAFYRL